MASAPAITRPNPIATGSATLPPVSAVLGGGGTVVLGGGQGLTG